MKSAGNTICINEHFRKKGRVKMCRDGVAMSLKARPNASKFSSPMFCGRKIRPAMALNFIIYGVAYNHEKIY